MPYSSTLTSKGQLTVPKEVRRRLGLREGDRVEFVLEAERTVIRREISPANPFRRYVGMLGDFPGGEKGRLAWLRDLREEDDHP